MEKISWRDKITNDDVLKRVNEERSLLKEIWQLKHRWIGHLLRHGSFLRGILKVECWVKELEAEGERRCFMI